MIPFNPFKYTRRITKIYLLTLATTVRTGILTFSAVLPTFCRRSLAAAVMDRS